MHEYTLHQQRFSISVPKELDFQDILRDYAEERGVRLTLLEEKTGEIMKTLLFLVESLDESTMFEVTAFIRNFLVKVQAQEREEQ